MSEPVAIVGAGLAGLCAARALHAAKMDFMVLEARDRPGGRILSADERGFPSADGFDLGPSWYWPHAQPPLEALVAELGLRTFCQNSDGDVIFERMGRETAQRYRPLGQVQQSMRFEGGTGALIRAIAESLPQKRLRFGASVNSLSLANGRVTLHMSTDSGPQTAEAGFVILAMPPRLIAANVAFTPALDIATRSRWRSTPTWMAPHAKFFAIYERAFWREAGLSGSAQSMVGPMPEMHDATTASGHAALFGFLAMGAQQRAIAGPEAVKRACLAQFARIFGEEATRPRATLYKDWAADPLTSTSADGIAGGAPGGGEGEWVSAAWNGRLALAGSETSPVDPGYLNGAVIAAERAVREFMSHNATRSRTSLPPA